MKIHRLWQLLLCLAFAALLPLAMVACPATTDDDDSADDDDDDAADDDAADDDASDDDTEPADAAVSGSVDREISTCPPNQDGLGDLCMFLLADCADSTNDAVATGHVANADMSFPTNAVDFTIEGLADGTYQLTGFLDDDSSGCDGAVTYGDFYMDGVCVEVEIVGQQDVTGVTMTFTSKCPIE
jgi:hypothetical protein